RRSGGWTSRRGTATCWSWCATGRPNGAGTGGTPAGPTCRRPSTARSRRRRSAGWLGGPRPVLVLTSPLQRARRTAELAGLAADPEPDLATREDDSVWVIGSSARVRFDIRAETATITALSAHHEAG